MYDSARIVNPIKAETQAATPAPLVASDGAFANWAAWPENARRRLLVAAVYVSVLTVAFVQPIMQLVSLALHSELHSHILLIPVIVGYLVYQDRTGPARNGGAPSVPQAAPPRRARSRSSRASPFATA